MNNRFKHRYNHARFASPCGKVSMTQQEYKDECDINLVLKKYAITGQVPNSRPVHYGDFSSVEDFQSAFARVNNAKEAFASLSAELRSRFGNSAEAFFEFVLNPANVEECQRLGLMIAKKNEESTIDVLRDIRNHVTTAKVASQSPVAGEVAKSNT